MLRKRVFKIIAFLMVLAIGVNVSVSFDIPKGGKFLEFGQEARAEINKHVDTASYYGEEEDTIEIRRMHRVGYGFGNEPFYEFTAKNDGYMNYYWVGDSGLGSGIVYINGRVYSSRGNFNSSSGHAVYQGMTIKYVPFKKGDNIILSAESFWADESIGFEGVADIYYGKDSRHVHTDACHSGDTLVKEDKMSVNWVNGESWKYVQPYRFVAEYSGCVRLYTKQGEKSPGGGIITKNYAIVKESRPIYVNGQASYIDTGKVYFEKGDIVELALDLYYMPYNGIYEANIEIYKTRLICWNKHPVITTILPRENEILSDLNNCIPSMTVSDEEGDSLTCKYYIDSVEKETKTISNTATAQVVNFSALDVSTLTEGTHAFKYEVSDGIAEPVIKTVTVTADKFPPVLKNVSFTSEDTSITISGTAEDSVSGVDSTGYRYTLGNNVSDWVADTSRKISTLLPNTLYNAKFEAKDKAGHIATAERNIYTKAQIPQIGINNIKENSMDLNINDSNPSTTQYQIMAGSGYVTTSGNITSSPVWITAADKKININGLSPNTQYQIKVKAKNGEGLETAFSTQTTGTTPSQPPNNIKLAPEINSMKISWEAVKGASGYDVEADSKVSDVGLSTQYIHTGLQAETTHTYRVRVRNAGGIGTWSGYISGTTLPNPPEVPVITETATTQSAITITWDAVAKATGYEIEADGKITDTNQETSYTDEGLKPDSMHKYRVRAKNAGGASEWSTAMEVSTLPIPPEIPEKLKAMPTRNTITLTWEKAARSEGYEIEADGVIVQTDTETYIHEGLFANSIHSYMIRALNRGGKSEWSGFLKITTWPEIPATPSNIMATAETGTISLTWYSSPFAESYDIQIDGKDIVNVKETLFSNVGLEDGTSHTYKIRAKNISGDGEWSKLLEISTLPIENTAPEEKAIIANIAAVVTNKTVTIAWQAVAANSQYEIEVDGVVSDNGKDTIYNHTGLEPVSFHTYRIRTKDADGKGEWCAVLALSTLPDPPGAPAGINAIASDTQIELTWTREEGTGYEVEVDGEVVDAGEADRYTDSGLNSGTTHTYRVRGKNISGVTAWSDSITKSTTSPAYEVECENGVEFNFSLLASNVQDFGDMTFVVTYNPEELEVEDLCEYTVIKDIISGSIAGTNLMAKTEEGRIEFMVNESIAAGTTWSGEITTIVFKPKVEGKATISFTVD